MAQIDNIKKQLEQSGLIAEVHDLNDEPYLAIRPKDKAKKMAFELVFDKSGELTHLVMGAKEDKVSWIDVSRGW